jgi:signal transduction histidine kinase
MKGKLNLFTRIGIFIFIVITLLSLLFIAITYLTTREFYQQSTQLTDKDVAAHIAKFASPFEEKGINKTIADSVFYNAMVLNPNIEVYFLDTLGNIIYYHAPDSTIKLQNIPLVNVRKFIQSKGEDYLKGPDPKNPSLQKVFSSAEVFAGNNKLGYIYVILGSNANTTASNMLLGSRATSLAVTVFCVIIILSVVISLLYIRRLQHNYKKIIEVLNEFMRGNLNARFNRQEKDEFAPITDSFNRMATLLSYNIDKLKQTEQERKNFIATISHDLRTPLAVAKGYTETALTKMNKGEIDQPEIDTFMQLVHKKLQQIERMVQDLFELSRMESVHFTPNKEPFIFSEILKEIYAVAERSAALKNIYISCDGCEDLSWINADIRMMERVVQNLFDNALKYTPSGGNISVSLQHTADILTASFINSGHSLSDELLNWINTTANDPAAIKPANTGLGLLIVKRILALHDYSFHVRSENDNIVAFTIQMKTTNPLLLS